MNRDSIRVEKYLDTDAKNYNHWIIMKTDLSVGKKDRREFIKFVETLFGKIGDRWQYQSCDFGRFIIKLRSGEDAVFFLLKYKKS
jgi:hypothetical protein